MLRGVDTLRDGIRDRLFLMLAYWVACAVYLAALVVMTFTVVLKVARGR